MRSGGACLDTLHISSLIAAYVDTDDTLADKKHRLEKTFPVHTSNARRQHFLSTGEVDRTKKACATARRSVWRGTETTRPPLYNLKVRLKLTRSRIQGKRVCIGKRVRGDTHAGKALGGRHGVKTMEAHTPK